MEDTLKDINAVSGVTGCFVCGREGQVLASALPSVFDEAILAAVGRIVAQAVAGLGTARRGKVAEIDLVYGQYRLITKNLRAGSLCIVCVRNVNLPLLHVASSSTARQLAAGLKASAQAKPLGPGESAAPRAEPIGAAFLGRVEKELARAIGPMASLVVDEGIEALGAQRESFPWHNLQRLVESLGTEIPDEEKRLSFVEAVAAALREHEEGEGT